MLFPAHNPTRPQTFLVRSGSKRVPWWAVVLTLLMIATATAAEDRETCQKAEGQAAVAACTAVISSGQLQGHDLAAAYFSRAFNLNKLGEADRAIADYSEAIRLDPKYVVALNNRCAVYNAKHEYDRAIHDCEQALQLNPNYANAYLGRANALRNKGAFDQAIKDYDQVIRLDPKTVGGFFGRALTLGAKGEYDRAIFTASSSSEIRATRLLSTIGASFTRKSAITIGQFATSMARSRSMPNTILRSPTAA